MVHIHTLTLLISLFILAMMSRIDIYARLEILAAVHHGTDWIVRVRVLLLEAILPNKEIDLRHQPFPPPRAPSMRESFAMMINE